MDKAVTGVKEFNRHQRVKASLPIWPAILQKSQSGAERRPARTQSWWYKTEMPKAQESFKITYIAFNPRNNLLVSIMYSLYIYIQ